MHDSKSQNKLKITFNRVVNAIAKIKVSNILNHDPQKEYLEKTKTRKIKIFIRKTLRNKG